MTRATGLDALLPALGPGADFSGLTGADWDVLIRLARAGDVLTRIGQAALASGVDVPPEIARHLVSAKRFADRQHEQLALELQVIDRAFATAGIPVLVLKGAAYVMAGLDASAGRTVSDIDLMVSPEALPIAESTLMMAGWVTSTRDAYDQRYYRTWMHEVPPMNHIARGTVIDLHHNILPPSGRIKLDAGVLMDASRALPGFASLRVLSSEDMVLHSAAHLIHEGELETGLRGIADLDALVRQFAREGEFLDRLLARAVRMQLTLPLHQSFQLARHFLQTPIPADVLADLGARAGVRPGSIRQGFLQWCWKLAIPPRHELLRQRWEPVARSALYLRGHWLRMPPWLLVRHLARKAVRAMFVADKGRQDT